MAEAIRALLVKTIGLGPEVEPEVKEMRASRLAAKVFLGIWPLYFSAVLVIGWPFFLFVIWAGFIYGTPVQVDDIFDGFGVVF